MMTDAELTEIAKRICNQGWVTVDNSGHLKLLRSIELAGLREAYAVLNDTSTDTPIYDLHEMIRRREKEQEGA